MVALLQFGASLRSIYGIGYFLVEIRVVPGAGPYAAESISSAHSVKSLDLMCNGLGLTTRQRGVTETNSAVALDSTSPWRTRFRRHPASRFHLRRYTARLMTFLTVLIVDGEDATGTFTTENQRLRPGSEWRSCRFWQQQSKRIPRAFFQASGLVFRARTKVLCRSHIVGTTYPF